jgi:DNA-directed RNA polymerase sigma subunit (sigma70/sigma32)
MKIKKSEVDECFEKTTLRPVLLKESDIKQIYAEHKRETAINFIITRNNPFVLIFARAWKHNAEKYGIEFSDLLGAGTLALIMATRKYELAKGSYYRYVGRYIQSYIQAEFYKYCNCSRLEGKRRHNKRELVNRVESLSLKIAYNGENELLTLEDVIAHPEDKRVLPVVEVNDLLRRLQKANGKIHPMASLILEMRFGVGAKRSEKPLSLKMTAKALDMSKEGIRKIENKVLGYLCSISK